MKVIEKEDCLQLWPAGGATAQLHQPYVTSWLFCFGFLPLCPFLFYQNDFSLLGRFLASLSSSPFSSLYQLWNGSYVPGVDPGTALVAPIEACGVSGLLAWRSSVNLIHMQVPGALEMTHWMRVFGHVNKKVYTLILRSHEKAKHGHTCLLP